jgi:succinyl-diaminopimelate desuccinylase
MRDNLRTDSSRSVAILSWLSERKEEMAALLSELVAIPTENPPGNHYRACADLLEQRLQQLDLECKRIGPAGVRNEPEEGPASLMANYGSGERTLYFH